MQYLDLYLKIFLTTVVLSVFIFLNSCSDTYGTDPYVKEIPKVPVDTVQKDNKIHAKSLVWRFKEVGRANKISEWPNSITFINNSAIIDTVGGKTFIWINLEMKANFSTYPGGGNEDDRNDRVEYVKIQVDSLEVINNKAYPLNNIKQGRYSRVELYSFLEKKKFSFDGSELSSMIRFESDRSEGLITGGFVLDFQMIEYIQTLQFLGNFTIRY